MGNNEIIKQVKTKIIVAQWLRGSMFNICEKVNKVPFKLWELFFLVWWIVIYIYWRAIA